MAKMAVDDAWRGKGIGRLLCEAIIERARELGGHTLMLYSNRAGAAVAIALYRKLGFQELPLPTKAYARADIYMELPVASDSSTRSFNPPTPSSSYSPLRIEW